MAPLEPSPGPSGTRAALLVGALALGFAGLRPWPPDAAALFGCLAVGLQRLLMWPRILIELARLSLAVARGLLRG